jgi:DNA-binding LytR/AlgR family response regulator
MLLPYSIFMIVTYYKDKSKDFKEIHLEPNIDTGKTVIIRDNSGVEKLILAIDNILYIKSADNYVEILHIENGEPTKTLIRNTIKNFETDFKDLPIIRCHRSFMINTKKIESARKTSSGFDVKINHISETIIPVSRSYVSELKKYATLLN